VDNYFLDTFIALRGRLAKVVTGIVPPSEIEDIVQETFVRVCQIKNKDAVREPQSFMFRTAKNLALDHAKRAESRLTTATDMIDDIPAAEFMQTSKNDTTYTQVASDEEFAQFCEAVRELPKQCRRAFILKKVYGFTLKEIMVEMNIGQPTVETYIVNGTKKCVKFLRDKQEKFPEKISSTKNSKIPSSNGQEGGQL
jgi:RNA polymerase sigma-70 factor (ECF subfamily)